MLISTRTAVKRNLVVYERHTSIIYRFLQLVSIK